jgi:DNA-binding SARP family transcriptional activator
MFEVVTRTGTGGAVTRRQRNLVTAAATPVSAGSGVMNGGRPSLSLLNAFELRCGGRIVTLPLSAQRLLAFIALRQHPLQRVYVAGTLWTDAPEERAAACLRSSLWRLNRSGYALVEATSTHLRLSSDVDVDIRRAFTLAHTLLDADGDWRNGGGDGSLLAAELLPDWYEDWVVLERERFRQLALHALEAVAARQLEAGHLPQALEAALTLVQGDALRESAHRLLIRVHLAEGNSGEAIRQFELCRRLLQERLGVEPSPQLVELVAPLTG